MFHRISVALLTSVLSLGTVIALPIDQAYAAGDAAKGEKLIKRCTACHNVAEAKAKPTGPHLIGVVGRTAGTTDYTKYSDGLKESGIVWDEAKLDEWLTDPKKVVKKARMNFKLRKEDQRADVIAYLKTLTE